VLGAPRALQRCPSQPRAFPVLRVDGAPHIPNYPFLSPSSIPASTNATPSVPHHAHAENATEEVESVRTGSGFWGHGVGQQPGEQYVYRIVVTLWVSPHSTASPQADDSDSTEIAAGSSYDGSVATVGESPLTRRRRRSSNSNNCNNNNCNCHNNISTSSNPRPMWGHMMRSS
jgi:hypothetical protein